MLSPSIVKKIKEKLVEVAEMYYEAGFNVLPLWSFTRDGKKLPAVRKGEEYQRWLNKRMTRDEFESFTLRRIASLEKPWNKVLGIAVVVGLNGLVICDYDPPKISEDARDRIKSAVDEFGTFVYFDHRIGIDGQRFGYHFALRVPLEIAYGEIRIDHSYNAEFSLRNCGIVAVAPSILFVGNYMSKYVKLSFVNLAGTYYDKDLHVLTRLVEVLGGKLKLRKASISETVDHDENRRTGKPLLGLKIGNSIKDAEKALQVLIEIGRAIDCEGFVAVIRSLMQGEWIVPYRIFKDEFGGVNHHRSTWTIVENHIFRILAEIGIPKEVGKEIAERIKKAQLMALDNLLVDHRSTDENLERSYKFKEHGHDPRGACIYKMLGLCPNTFCNDTVLTRFSANPELIKRIVLKVIEHD